MRKSVIITLLILCCPLISKAQGGRYDNIVLAGSGRPVGGALVSVCSQPATISGGTCTTLITVYTDTTDGTACTGSNQFPPPIPSGPATGCSNPLLTNGYGNFHFYAPVGTKYTIVISGVGITTTTLYDQVTGTTGTGAITSVFGRTGIVVATNGDYSCTLVTNCPSTSANNTWTGNQTFTGSGIFKGYNPWTDITAFGAIATNGPFQTTASFTSGNPQITVAGAGNFPVNGVGITLQGAGPSVTMSTPGAPTVTPQYASGPQRDHLLVNSPTGSSNYLYCIVAEDKGQGLTPCSSTTTITNGPATLGEQSATITSESLSNGTLTVNTSSGVFVNAMMVDVISGIPRFSGVMKTNTGTTNSFTIAKYMNDDRVVPQFITDVPNSTSATGTVNYYQANTIKWTVVTGARRYWICAQRPGDSSLHLIGQSDMTSGSWQGNQYEDWGSAFLANQAFPYYITDAICTGAGQPDALTTTVASGANTTTPTLTVAPSQTNNSNTMKATKDDSTAFSQAAAQASNGNGCVYVPPQSSVLLTFHIESFTSLAAGICIIQSGAINLDDTLELNNVLWRTQNQQGVPQFGIQSGASVKEMAANPAFHLIGQGNSISGVTFSDTANGATILTIDSSSSKLSGVNCSLTNSNDTLGICTQYRGIIGGNVVSAIINDGSNFVSGLSQTTDASWTPLIDDGPAQDGSGNLTIGNGVELHIQDLFDSRRTISYSGGGFLSLFHHYIQGPITPIVMFDSTSGGGISPIYLNDVIGDTTGVSVVANISNVSILVIRFDGVISSSASNPIVSGTRPASVSYGAYVPFGLGSYGNIDNNGCIPFTVITGTYEGSGNPPSGVAHPVCKTQGPSVQGGGYPLIAAPLPAPATPTVSGPSAGGSIPISTFLYAVSATGFDGGDTMPSPVPSSSITTTPGNQTVTVNWVSVVGAKSYNIWRCDTAAVGGCFTSLPNNTPFIGPNWKEVAFHQTGTSFNDTVAAPSASTYADQTATGISQMDANEAVAPQYACPETTAPTAVSLFDQQYCDSTTHRYMENSNGGSVWLVRSLVVCSGTYALSTGNINNNSRTVNMFNTCPQYGTAANINHLTDHVTCSYVGDVNGQTGYAVSAPFISLRVYIPTSDGAFDVDQINQTGAAIPSPGAASVECAVTRP